MAKTKPASKAPKAKAKGIKIHFEIPEGGQFASVVEVFEYATKLTHEIKEIYTLALDGDETKLFKLFEDDNLKLSLGDICRPVIVIAASAYVDARGQAKPQNITAVHWVKDESAAESSEESESLEEAV